MQARTPCSRSPTRCSRCRRARASTSTFPLHALGGGHARSRRREPARAGLRARRRRRRDQASRRARSPRHIDVTFAKQLLVVVDRLVGRRRGARPSRRRGRHGVPRGRRRLRHPVHRAGARRARRTRRRRRRLRFTERFECANDGTTRARADAAALLVQQPARRVPAVQRLRRDARVRRGAHRSLPRRARCATARSIRGRSRATTTSAARSPSSRRGKASRWTRRGRSSPAAREKLLRGKAKGYKGIFPFLVDLEDKKYKQYIRVFLRQYQTAQECPDCHGTKLQPEALQVRIADRTIAEVSELPVDRLLEWLEHARARPTFERAGRRAHPQGSARSRAVPLRRRARTTSR